MHTVPMDTVMLHGRGKKQKKLHRLLQKAIQAAPDYLPGMLGFYFLHLAECFGLPSPFAICMMAVWLGRTGKCPRGSRIGAAAAAISRFAGGAGGDWMQTAVLFLMPFIMRRKVSVKKIYLLATVSMITRSLPVLFIADTQHILLHLAGILLGLCMMPAVMRAVQVMESLHQEKTEDDTFCLSMLGMLVLCGAAHIGLFGMNLGVMVAGVCVLFAAWQFGAQSGAVCGIGAGLAVYAGGQTVVYLVLYPVAGLLAGCFHDRRRGVAGCVFLFAAVALGYIMMQKLPKEMVMNGIGCVSLFMALPEKKARKWLGYWRVLQKNGLGENAYLCIRMQEWQRAVKRLENSLPFPQVPMENSEDEMEELAENLCDQCERLPICWHEEYEKTKHAMAALAACREVDLTVINRYFDQCLRIGKIPEVLKPVQNRQRETKRQMQLAEYHRMMTSTHLSALSRAANTISLECQQRNEEEKEWLDRGAEVLRRMHFTGRILFVKRVEGRLVGCVQSDYAAIQPKTARKLADQLGLYWGVPLSVKEANVTRVVLEEATMFDWKKGIASVCAKESNNYSAQEAEGKNGDAVLVQRLHGGKVLFAVSDGMGHGSEAHNESCRTLDMLAACLEAGYTREETTKVVNGAMLNASRGENFATVDMVVVDLCTGEAEMNKLGACASYVIQGQRVYKMMGESLPLGIIEYVTPAEKRVELAEGDSILMMTDGVQDMFESEREIIRLLEIHRGDEPQVIADALLQEALDRQRGLPVDDMTVLCIQLTVRLGNVRRRGNIPA